MGRLTLNVLLSFAQFEREVTGERIRDKIAASKKKGLWMGGWVPIGYDLKGRTLIANEAEAETIRTIFRLYTHEGRTGPGRTGTASACRHLGNVGLTAIKLSRSWEDRYWRSSS
jgi:DNA invertase Pin-like site-specific DNA recombinase